MAAADQLNKAGHSVFVYERANRIGGLLQYGIPTMKLSKKDIGTFSNMISIMTTFVINFILRKFGLKILCFFTKQKVQKPSRARTYLISN